MAPCLQRHILWNNRGDNWLKQRLRAVGRMALTNYLAQTVLGVLVLTTLFVDIDFVNRGLVLVFVIAVWLLQLWWSPAWLSRFLFGPAEWLWRVATYRSGQPFVRNRRPTCENPPPPTPCDTSEDSHKRSNIFDVYLLTKIESLVGVESSRGCP